MDTQKDRMRRMTCCFTGHRRLDRQIYFTLRNRLDEEIKKLILNGVRYFGCGGALGFDTMAALSVCRLKEKYPHIRLIMVLPCPNYNKYWSHEDKQVLKSLISQADKVVYTSKYYSQTCMRKRNYHLVDHSQTCLCYLNRDRGGTALTVKYAQEQGLRIINLASECE